MFSFFLDLYVTKANICAYAYIKVSIMLPHLFFKLLSDETRVRCLLLIARNTSLCVAEITEALQESQPKVSRHLALLRTNGILNNTRKGQWIYYSINNSLPGWAHKQISDLIASKCLKTHYNQDIERLNAIKNNSDCCI